MKSSLILFITLVQLYITNAQKANLVLKNGNIITLSGNGSRTSALAVKDGLILAAGNDRTMEKYISPAPRSLILKAPPSSRASMMFTSIPRPCIRGISPMPPSASIP